MRTWDGLAIAVPTFGRNTALAALLQSIEAQSMHPSMVLVVDNNPADDARSVVDAFRPAASFRLDYLPMGRNTGPAGAFSGALTCLHGVEGIEWMMCRGDDNPFTDPDTIAEMRDFSHTVAHLSPAGIGNRGVTFDANRASGVDIADDVLASAPWLATDALPGGGSPTYHIGRVLSAGVNFDPFLFFGYEELDFGLRLKQRALPLFVKTAVQMRLRRQFGTKEGPNPAESPWRTYFEFRNLLIVARRYGSTGGFAMLVLKAIAKTMIAAVGFRSFPGVVARFRGTLDGAFNRPADARYIPRRQAKS